MTSVSSRIIDCARCGTTNQHAGRGLCCRCYDFHYKHGGLEKYPKQTPKRDYYRPNVDPALADHALVERILGGDWRIKSRDPHTKAEVCRRWVQSGRTLKQLAELTGWAPHRYYQLQESDAA